MCCWVTLGNPHCPCLRHVWARDYPARSQIPQSTPTNLKGALIRKSENSLWVVQVMSGIGIIGDIETPRSYSAHLYYTRKQMYEWRFYFVITPDLEATNMVRCYCMAIWVIRGCYNYEPFVNMLAEGSRHQFYWSWVLCVHKILVQCKYTSNHTL